MQEECSFLHLSLSTVICLSNEVVLLMKIGYFKILFFTKCDKMLKFVNLKKWGYLCSSVHPGCKVESFVKPFDVLVD